MEQIVSDIVSCENEIHQFFRNQKIGRLLKNSNVTKEKGISPVSVFRLIFTLVFTGKNLFRTLDASDGTCGMAKDTVYRFLNSVHANWRRFLLLLSTQVIRQELEPLTSPATLKVLIADDTLYRRNRSKQVELLSWVFDHIEKRFYRGFRMLTLGWSDGISFLPVSCALLGSSKEKHRLVPQRTDIDRRTNGAKRRKDGTGKATDVLVELVSLALASGIRASHLLFDSWFAFPVTIRKLRAQGIHIICMLKITPKIFYRYQEENLPLAAIYKKIRKRAGRAKILASIIVEIGEDEAGAPVPARIVFVRDRRSKKWLALLSTDTSLADEEIVQTYKRRWDIGVSREVRIIQSVEVRPRLKDPRPRSLEGVVARKQDGGALRHHPLQGGCATHQVVTCSERRRSLVTRIPVAETVDNARRQQEIPGEVGHIRYFSPAGYQRRHGVKDYAGTGEALGARRRNLDEEFPPITLNGKWREWHQGGGSGRTTIDPRAVKHAGREGPGPVDIPFGKVRYG